MGPKVGQSILRGSRSSLLCVIILLLSSLQLIGPGQALAPAEPLCAKFQETPVLSPGSPGAWDSQAIGRQSVIYNGSYYLMWYNAIPSLEIGFAYSTDGVHWTKGQGPVLTRGPSGSWDGGGVDGASVVWNGTDYLMYYSGSNGTFVDGVGLAVSKDGIAWARYPGNPVVQGTAGTFDGYFVRYPDVLLDDGQYHMWYTARSSPSLNDSIGYATSADGLHWTRSPVNPVITAHSSDRSIYLGARYPSVAKVGSTYLMVFLLTNLSDDISYATSQDGEHWNVSDSVLLSNTNSTSDWDFIPYYPSLIVNQSTVLLWYSGKSTNIPPYPAIGFARCALVVVPVTSITTTTYLTTLTSYSATTTTSVEVPGVLALVYPLLITILALGLLISILRIRSRERR